MDNINFNYDPKGWTLKMIRVFLMAVTLGLGLRFVLSLLSIDSDALNGFVGWVYDMTNVLVAPFRGIFGSVGTTSDYPFEFVTLFALAAWMVAGMVAVRVVHWSTKK